MQNLREKEKLHNNKSALWFGFKPPKSLVTDSIAHMRRFIMLLVQECPSSISSSVSFFPIRSSLQPP